MIPCAAFFGIFMAAILNLPDKPMSHKLWLLIIFLCIVVIEKIADLKREDLQGFYALMKGGICFVSFVALSIVYATRIAQEPLKLFGIVVGGVLFGMAIYMPIRFQDGEKQKESAESLDRSLPKNGNE